MADTEEQRGRQYLSRLLDVSYDLSQKGPSDPKKQVDSAHIRAELRAGLHWIDTVLIAEERLSAELTAYRAALSELHASTEARLLDYASDPADRTHSSQRLDADIARAREILETYDPVVKNA